MSQHTTVQPTSSTGPGRPSVLPRRWPLHSLLLPAGPLLVLASELAAPRQPDGLSGKEEASFLLGHQERFLVSGLLGLAAAVVLLAAFTTLAQRMAGRGRVVARVGSLLGVAGALGLAMHMSITLAGRDILLDDPTAYAATSAASNGTAAVVAVISLVLGMNLAMVLLGIAAHRARLAGWWVVAAGVLALVSDFSPTSWNTVLWALFATVVMAVLARAVTDEDLV